MIPKIADFGLSKIVKSKCDKNNGLFETKGDYIKGTPVYISPEIWERKKYTQYSDVYAYSLILYEIFTGDRLFNKCINLNIQLKLIEGYRPPFNKPIPLAYKNLIERCWREIPYSRPTFDEISFELKNDKKFITEKVDESS